MSNPPPIDPAAGAPHPPSFAELPSPRDVPASRSSLPLADRETAIALSRDAETARAARAARVSERAPHAERRRAVRGQLPAHLAIPVDQPWCPPTLAEHLEWGRHVSSDPLVEVTWTGPRAWRSAGVSVRGARQARERMHREESIAVTGDANTLIVCLADGASSSRWARIAAEFVCRTVPGNVLRELDDDPDAAADADASTLGRSVGRAIGLATGHAWHGLRALAAATRSSPADFRTTLLLGVLRRSRAGSYWFLNRIGDGMAVIRDAHGALLPALPPAGPDDRGDAGCRLPDAHSADRVARIRVLPAQDVDALVLMSAGSEPLPGFPPLSPRLAPDDATIALREWLLPPIGADTPADPAADDEDRSVLVAWRSVNGIAVGESR